MKIRKGKQLSLINFKKAGRPAINDAGIRHTTRPRFAKPTALHLTIKVRSNKADIQNKIVLKTLHRAIFRGRMKGLKIIHYALEYNHIHLLVEAKNNLILHKGMQSLGITLAKGINKFKRVSGTVYKHRYHFRQISGPRQIKNVINYIFNNGVKHGNAHSKISFYNSMVNENRLEKIYPQEARLWAEIQKSPQLRGLLKTLLITLDDNHFYLLSPDRRSPGKS